MGAYPASPNGGDLPHKPRQKTMRADLCCLANCSYVSFPLEFSKLLQRLPHGSRICSKCIGEATKR
jgi:hypothetical protein